MKYLVVLFWSLLMGQMVAYLGAALSHTGYSPLAAFIGSLVLSVVVFILGKIAPPNKKREI